MATTKRITQVLERLGFDPEEDKSIVVSYAPVNLSDRIRKLFFNNYYSLSLCRESIVMLPFSTMWMDVKKEVALEMPYSSIYNIKVEEEGLSYRIDIKLEDEDETISLMAQQGELSELRMSGMYSLEDWTFVNNWHKNNLNETLKALKEIGRK